MKVLDYFSRTCPNCGHPMVAMTPRGLSAAFREHDLAVHVGMTPAELQQAAEAAQNLDMK